LRATHRAREFERIGAFVGFSALRCIQFARSSHPARALIASTSRARRIRLTRSSHPVRVIIASGSRDHRIRIARSSHPAGALIASGACTIDPR